MMVNEFKNQGVIVRLTYVLAIVCVLGTTLRASAAEELHAADPPEVQGSLEGVTVEAPEPRYVAPTLRDRIGRIWAPVYINGQGPFRLVLDSGATNSAIVRSVAERLGLPVVADKTVMLRGVTGNAELLGGPQSEQFVAPCVRLEAEFLVMSELLLEAFLALVQRAHAFSNSLLTGPGWPSLREPRCMPR